MFRGHLMRRKKPILYKICSEPFTVNTFYLLSEQHGDQKIPKIPDNFFETLS